LANPILVWVGWGAIVFVISLRPDRTCSDPIKALRWVLKRAGRLGLRAVDVREETDTGISQDIDQQMEGEIK
jgi:hypothetical protein